MWYGRYDFGSTTFFLEAEIMRGEGLIGVVTSKLCVAKV